MTGGRALLRAAGQLTVGNMIHPTMSRVSALVSSAIVVLSTAALVGLASARAAEPPQGWTTVSPRDEIRPTFSYLPSGGRDGRDALVIQCDHRPGLQGWWTRTFVIQGGGYYRFSAFRRAENVPAPRRSVMARVLWQDDDGQGVMHDQPLATNLFLGQHALAEAEHPADRATDARGWTEVSGVYRVPSKATRAVVELHLQWAPDGKVEWSDVSIAPCSPPPGRKVRLAAVHFQPKNGKSPDDNCRAFAPLVEQAAAKKADLLVLPETLTQTGLGKTYAEVAEPIPGPSTEYFGALAKKHDLYIVAGLVEREGHLIYNVAALIGPDGKLVGKYRKVTLPRGEIEMGVAPGNEYPVFDTRIGKVGMMVCYDGFFPEVARELSNGGAQIIAWPVAGCNPLLAQARACENHVYLVSSTYSDVSMKWTITAVYDRQGQVLAQAKDWGTLAIAEVDLDVPTYWWNLGDFKAMVDRHRPIIGKSD